MGPGGASQRDLSWEDLLTAPTNTLTHLTVKDELLCNDELIRVLVEHAPALTHLSVGWAGWVEDDHASTSWGVEQLCVLEEGEEWDVEVLSRLPRHREGRVVVVKTPDETARLTVRSTEVSAVHVWAVLVIHAPRQHMHAATMVGTRQYPQVSMTSLSNACMHAKPA